MGFKKGTVLYISYYSIKQTSFNALKISLCFTYPSLFQPPGTPGNPVLFTITVVLVIVGIIQYGAFQTDFFSLSNTYSRFIHVFSWLYRSFLFFTEQ